MRFTKTSVLVLSVFVLCAGMSLASGPNKNIPSKIFPSSPQTVNNGGKVKLPTAIVTKVVNPQSSKVINPQSNKVVQTKVTMVIPSKVSMVINPKVSNVVVTKVIPTKVLVTMVHHHHHPHIIWEDCFGIFGCYGFELPALPVQYERYLRLHNDTTEKMVVYLRYHTQDVTGEWDWIPEAPLPAATKWLAFELQPGEVLEPKFGDLPIAANRIRLYAESATRSWTSFKDDDFWLVPEMTNDGEHLYFSPYRQTFDFYVNGTK